MASEESQKTECYLCIKGAPHHHEKATPCYLSLKNGKTVNFSDTEKYKKHLKTEQFL